VDSDKISKILEKQLKALGQPVRIDILKKLYNNEKPLSFSMLQKEVFRTTPNSANFSFHLKSLREIEFISLLEEGYSITSIGKTMLKNILSMEQVINDQNKTVMVRTSKYSKEPFNIEKVVKFLIKEGDMEQFLANKIAQEVKERLSKANIGYLTAPLIREYINAVLLENGLEEVRHKLTRLGSPPFEVSNLFNDNLINPELFIKKLGSEVSEQFLLLNLLPKNLADMYLSGEIALLHLNNWSLKPLSLYIDSNSIIEAKSIRSYQDFMEFFLKYMEKLFQLKPYFSQDVLLRGFNRHFLSNLKSLGQNKITNLMEIISSQLFKFNALFDDSRSHLSLDFLYCDEVQSKIDNQFLDQLRSVNQINLKPHIFLDYSKIDISDLLELDEIIFYNNDNTEIMNSANVCVKNLENNNIKIVLDKILINLHLIANQSNRNDSKFYDLLSGRLNSVFQFYDYKEKLVYKKLSLIKTWNNIMNEFLGGKENEWVQDSVKSISFFGLNEAIKHHCSIELDRVERSENFAIKILTLLRQLIKEKNERDGTNFTLSQPHEGAYLKNGYSSRIIRKDSKLTLEKQISLFKKFETILDGGSLFRNQIPINELKKEDIEVLKKSKLNAFT